MRNPAELDALDDDDLERVKDARSAARTLRWMALGAALLGVAALILTVWAYLEGSVSIEAALGFATSSGFFAILSGATAYGAGSNLDVSASRLEREVIKMKRDRG